MASRLHAHIGTFRQLEILLSVYNHKSVKQASEKLHLTQPTISMQLKKLSDVVGMPLYNQIGKKLVFTEAGESVAAAAKDTLERMQQLDMDLSDLRGLKAGTLKLSVVTTSKYFIPHLLGPFCKRYPAVDIEFNVGNRQQIIKRMEQGNDDFYVFSNVPKNFELDTIDFLDNPLVVLANQQHPLVNQPIVELAEIAKEPFLMRERGSGTRFAIEKFLAKHEIELNVRMTIESNEAIKHSVMSGLGISILSQHTLAFGDSKGLAKLNVKNFPINSKWYLLKLKSKKLSPIAKTFLNYIETEGRENLLKEINL